MTGNLQVRSRDGILTDVQTICTVNIFDFSAEMVHAFGPKHRRKICRACRTNPPSSFITSYTSNRTCIIANKHSRERAVFISYLSGHYQASSGPVVWHTTLNPSTEKGPLALAMLTAR